MAIKLLEQPTCAASVSRPQSLLHYVRQTRYKFYFAFLSTTCHLEMLYRSPPTRIFLRYLASCPSAPSVQGQIGTLGRQWRHSNGNVKRLISYRYDIARRKRHIYFYFFLTQNIAYEGTFHIVR